MSAQGQTIPVGGVVYIDEPGFVAPPATAPPPSLAPTVPPPPPPTVSTQSAPIPQPGTVYIETTYTPAPPAVAPTAPPPQAAPAAPAAPTTPAPAAPTTQPTTDTTVSTQGQPIPRPGVPLVEIDTGNVIPAPDRTDLPAQPPTQTPAGTPEDDLPDLDGRFLAAIATLSGMPFVQYVRNSCDARNLDDLAVFANAMREGLHGGIGDDGTSFGPWNMHQGGALPKKYWTRPPYDPATQAWTWTRQGIDYALDGMVKGGAAGKRGHNAVEAIVRGFEKPANIGGEIVIRNDYYDQLAKLGDPYALLASQAAGPTGGGAAAAPAPAPTKQSGTGTVASWRDFLDGLETQTGRAQTAVNSVHSRMVKAVK